jgi:hypothetical protein
LDSAPGRIIIADDEHRRLLLPLEQHGSSTQRPDDDGLGRTANMQLRLLFLAWFGSLVPLACVGHLLAADAERGPRYGQKTPLRDLLLAVKTDPVGMRRQPVQRLLYLTQQVRFVIEFGDSQVPADRTLNRIALSCSPFYPDIVPDVQAVNELHPFGPQDLSEVSKLISRHPSFSLP